MPYVSIEEFLKEHPICDDSCWYTIRDVDRFIETLPEGFTQFDIDNFRSRMIGRVRERAALMSSLIDKRRPKMNDWILMRTPIAYRDFVRHERLWNREVKEPFDWNRIDVLLNVLRGLKVNTKIWPIRDVQVEYERTGVKFTVTFGKCWVRTLVFNYHYDTNVVYLHCDNTVLAVGLRHDGTPYMIDYMWMPTMNSVLLKWFTTGQL